MKKTVESAEELKEKLTTISPKAAGIHCAKALTNRYTTNYELADVFKTMQRLT